MRLTNFKIQIANPGMEIIDLLFVFKCWENLKFWVIFARKSTFDAKKKYSNRWKYLKNAQKLFLSATIDQKY